MLSRTVAKLRDLEYRKAFVASQINIGIPFQIRGLLQSRGWKQEDLVKRTGMLQPRISALLTPGKVRPNIETLRRIAEAFDCGLEVRFVPFGELVRWSEHFNPEHFAVPSFAEEIHETEEVEKWGDALVTELTIPPESTQITVLPGNVISYPLLLQSEVTSEITLQKVPDQKQSQNILEHWSHNYA